MDKFKGTGVALITPFNETGKIDYSALQKLAEFQIQNGVNYLVVQGTTGESVTLINPTLFFFKKLFNWKCVKKLIS